jgi:hypothetical protein
MSQDLFDAVRDWLTSGALAAGGRRLVAAVAVVAGAFVLAQVLRWGSTAFAVASSPPRR